MGIGSTSFSTALVPQPAKQQTAVKHKIPNLITLSSSSSLTRFNKPVILVTESDVACARGVSPPSSVAFLRRPT
jgi:hypothetical protein